MSNALTVQTRNKHVVWLSKIVHQYIIDEASKWGNLETGGVLVGYFTDEAIVVTKHIGPGAKAKHSATSFEPDNKFHKVELASIYKNTNQTERYLGDWHTHPNSTAYLSDKDKQTLRKIAHHRKAQMKTPIMLVLGTKNGEIKIWRHVIKDGKEEAIEPCMLILY